MPVSRKRKLPASEKRRRRRARRVKAHHVQHVEAIAAKLGISVEEARAISFDAFDAKGQRR